MKLTRIMSRSGASVVGLALTLPTESCHKSDNVSTTQPAGTAVPSIVEHTVAAASASLDKGDEQLEAGDKGAALNSFRTAARQSVGTNAYLVDGYGSVPGEPPPTFKFGCGSQGDNALIKRFIAIGADGDAADEFARVWKLYTDRPPTTHRFGTGPHESNRRQFVIDYGYFLKRHGEPAAALDLLRDEVLRTDLDGEFHPYLLSGMSLPDCEMGINEFLKLAFGEFQSAGRGDELIAAVRKRIGDGNNPARRTLARMRLLAGKPDDALQLELDYVREGHFNTLSTQCRIASIQESSDHPAAAAAEYEKALKLPWEPLDLPADGPLQPSASITYNPKEGLTIDPSGMLVIPPDQLLKSLRVAILTRLVSIHASTNQTAPLLAAEQNLLDASDPTSVDFGRELKAAVDRFTAAGKRQQLLDWAKAKAAASPPAARAEIDWGIGDTDGAATAVADMARLGEVDWVKGWKTRFEWEQLGPKLAEKLVAVTPDDLDERVKLLAVDPAAGDRQWAPVLEKIIEKLKQPRPEYTTSGIACVPDPHVSGGGPAPYFRNTCDVAYRLMRCYDRAGQIDKLEALGVEIAGAAKPFETAPAMDSLQNTYVDDATAAISLAIARADTPEARSALAAALKDSPWHGQTAQLDRRQSKTWPPLPAAPFGWANVPDGVTVMASNGTALSLAVDASHLFVGEPWGVAVYKIDGSPVCRVALGHPVIALAVNGGAVWAGTRDGLYRIDFDHWRVARVRAVSSAYFVEMAAVGPYVWVFTEFGAVRIDSVNSRQRSTTLNSLYWESKDPVPAEPLLIDGGFIYRHGVRYDPDRDKWDACPAAAVKIVDGVLWGLQHFNTDRIEPRRCKVCTIDRKTLAITPIPIVPADRRSRPVGTAAGIQRLSYAGRLDGRPVFRADYQFVQLDRDGKRLVEVAVPDDSTTGEPAGLTRDAEAPRWTDEWSRVARLPNGGWAVARGSDSHDDDRQLDRRYEYPQLPRPAGLAVAGPGQPARMISNGPQSDVIAGDCVYTIAADGRRMWLTTDRGVSLLDEHARVLANFDSDNGMPSGRVVSAVALGGHVYFAVRHDDSGGGLVDFDPDRRTFTLRLPIDGLATGAVQDLTDDGGRLVVGYAYEYLRAGNQRGYRRFPPTRFDPSTNTFSKPGVPKYSGDGPSDSPDRYRTMPLLGGVILSEQTIDGRVWRLGSRGAVVTDAGREVDASEAPDWVAAVDTDDGRVEPAGLGTGGERRRP